MPPHGIQISDQTHLTGLVRGAKKHFKTRVSRWIQVAELIDVMWSSRRVNIGTRSLLSLCASDDKGRFILAGHPSADPRGEFIDTGIWPTWISASHGHNKKIASQTDNSAIAIAWFSGEERGALGDTAAFPIPRQRRIPATPVPSYHPRCCLLDHRVRVPAWVRKQWKDPLVLRKGDS